MKIAVFNIDWARKKDSLELETFINTLNFDFLILTEAVQLHLDNFKYTYSCSPIPENIIYENLNYTEYLKGKQAFRTILYSKLPYSKKYPVTDDKTNLALEFETEYGNIVFYCTIIGTWFNRKPFVENELKNTVQDCTAIHSINKNIIIVGDLNTSFRQEEMRLSINSSTTEALKKLIEDLDLINVTGEITQNIDHIIIPKTLKKNILEAKTFVDKNILSDHKGVYISLVSDI